MLIFKFRWILQSQGMSGGYSEQMFNVRQRPFQIGIWCSFLGHSESIGFDHRVWDRSDRKLVTDERTDERKQNSLLWMLNVLLKIQLDRQHLGDWIIQVNCLGDRLILCPLSLVSDRYSFHATSSSPRKYRRSASSVTSLCSIQIILGQPAPLPPAAIWYLPRSNQCNPRQVLQLWWKNLAWFDEEKCGFGVIYVRAISVRRNMLKGHFIDLSESCRLALRKPQL